MDVLLDQKKSPRVRSQASRLSWSLSPFYLLPPIIYNWDPRYKTWRPWREMEGWNDQTGKILATVLIITGTVIMSGGVLVVTWLNRGNSSRRRKFFLFVIIYSGCLMMLIALQAWIFFAMMGTLAGILVKYVGPKLRM
jgi:hypothetical protein